MEHLKQNIVIITDHSKSMYNLANKAKEDYNSLIKMIKESSRENNVSTYLTSIKCGVHLTKSTKDRYFSLYQQNNTDYAVADMGSYKTDINYIQPMNDQYVTNGNSTPLFDSVGMAIEELSDSDIPVLVMVITDGAENGSKKWTAHTLTREMIKLQNNGLWTFAFRVPRGYSGNLINMGIPSGNILEWDQTEKGFEHSTEIAASSMRNYYTVRSSGQSSTNKFFVDTTNLVNKDIRQNMIDISRNITRWNVSRESDIKTYVEKAFGYYQIGDWYYRLNKPETLQISKKIIIRNTKTGETFTGQDARHLLGLPSDREVKIVPKKMDYTYEVYIQSMSVNRKLTPGMNLIHYKTV